MGHHRARPSAGVLLLPCFPLMELVLVWLLLLLLDSLSLATFVLGRQRSYRNLALFFCLSSLLLLLLLLPRSLGTESILKSDLEGRRRGGMEDRRAGRKEGSEGCSEIETEGSRVDFVSLLHLDDDRRKGAKGGGGRGGNRRRPDGRRKRSSGRRCLLLLLLLLLPLLLLLFLLLTLHLPLR